MPKENQINHQKVGDKAVDTENYNKIIDSANQFNNLFFDPVTMEYYSDDGINIMSIASTGTDVDLDSEATAKATDPSGGLRKTLENNPSSNSDSYEYQQIFDANNAAANATSSVPIFIADDTPQADSNIGASGATKFVAYDSTYRPQTDDEPTTKSFEITTDMDTDNVPDKDKVWNEDTNSFKETNLYGIKEINYNAEEITTEKIDSSEIEWEAGSEFTEASGDTKYVLVVVKGGETQEVKYLYPTELNVVTNMTYDGYTGELIMTKTPAYVLGYSTSGEVEDIITTASDCPPAYT